MNFIGSTIEMFRGDSETMTFKLRDNVTKILIPLVTGDTVRFTVRRTENDAVTFQKVVIVFVAGEAKIPILPVDTKSKDKGRYVYDTEVTFLNGDVKTVIKGVFVIEGDVTYV